MPSRVRSLTLPGTLALAAVALSRPEPAYACGGCFNPPPAPDRPATSQQQVVTDHRMVLALSTTQSTLWDQFGYAGSPDEFFWVLPVADVSRVRVGVADNAFLDAVDQLSVVTLQATVPTCDDGFSYDHATDPLLGTLLVLPPEGRHTLPPFARGGCSVGFGCANSGTLTYTPNADMQAGSDSVVVTSMNAAVVGPYSIELVDSASSSGGLQGWLAAHQLMVPPAAVPPVEYYQSHGFDFVAVRLRPGVSVQRMQPIRVTVDGYVPTLPLRMIAAGTADKVGITLMVLANGRMEVQGEENLEIAGSELTWDVTAGTSDYRAVFARKLVNARAGAWVVESASSIDSERMGAIGFGDAGTGREMDGGEVRTDAGGDAEAGVPMASPFVDREVAFVGLGRWPVLTRLRTEFRSSWLARDMALLASLGGTIPTERVLTRFSRVPACRFGSVPPTTRDAGGTDARRDASMIGVLDPGSLGAQLGGGTVVALALLTGARRRQRKPR